MKSLTFTRKVLAILIVAICCQFSFKMTAQTIQIDSTFFTDGEIFPFGPNDTIYGLSISGHVTLSSDNSLVRVILTDDSGNEWMVYEAYPMIVENTDFNYTEESDETFTFSGLIPLSIKIYLTRASLRINTCQATNNAVQNPVVQQFMNKTYKDVVKAININGYIDSNGWNWNADTTSITRLFYHEKKNIFGPDFNLLGLDYYSGGVFYSNRLTNRSIDNSDLTKSFDWRKKHDAHLASSFYWDHYPEKYFIDGEWKIDSNGWITRLRNQGGTSACSIFSSIASLSAVTNLYFNFHVDYEYKYWLSERQVYNCTPYHINNVGCDPSVGIENGLLTFGLNPDALGLDQDEAHAVSLVGFEKDPETGIINWILKNSWGEGWGKLGYFIGSFSLEEIFKNEVYIIGTPITTQPANLFSREKYDADADGYWNWGIGSIPEGWLPPCNPENPLEDWNDNDNRVGPCYVNFIGIPVRPEIQVCWFKNELLPKVYIENNGFFYFDDEILNDLHDNTFIFRIEDPGKAQLNLTLLYPVTCNNEINFHLNSEQLKPTICMNDGY